HTVRQHIPECTDAFFLSIQPGEAEAAATRHVNALDCGRFALDELPYAEGVEGAATAIRQRGGALVEARVRFTVTGHHGLDHGHAQTQRRECQRKAGTNHTAACDDDIEFPNSVHLTTNGA